MATRVDGYRHVARTYVETTHDLVPGFMERRDARLWLAIDQLQRDLGIGGDLLEIGCYLGRSAIVLGYVRGDGERVVLNDLFGRPAETDANAAENDRLYQRFQEDDFLANWAKFLDTPPELVIGPSSQLHNAGLARSFRFVHVDGSHMYDAVVDDVLLTKNLVVPGAVAVFDDIRNDVTPGVAAAVWPEVASGAFVPLAITNQLYVTTPDSPLTVDALDASLAEFALHTTRQEVAGHDVLLVRGGDANHGLGARLNAAFTPPWVRYKLRVMRRRRAALRAAGN